MRNRMIMITGPVPYYSPSRPEMLKNENDDDLRACSRYKIFDHDFQQTMPCLSSCLRNTQFWIWTLTPFLMILFQIWTLTQNFIYLFINVYFFLDLDSDPDILREIPHLPVFSEKAFTQTGLTLRSKDEEEKKDW